MNKNKTVVYLTILAVLLIICLPTYIKINQKHQERLDLVSEKKIIESAMLCFNEDVCKKNVVTMKELKELGYLTESVINQKTHEYYKEDTKIEKKGKNYQIII